MAGGGDTMRLSSKWRRRGKRGANIEWAFFLAVISICWLGSTSFVLAKRQQPIYQNQFAVYIPSGRDDADLVADKHGFVNLGQVTAIILSNFTNLFIYFYFY